MANKDEEIEGMYTLVGDPDNPELEAADDSKISLTDRIKRIKKKVFKEEAKNMFKDIQITSGPPLQKSENSLAGGKLKK